MVTQQTGQLGNSGRSELMMRQPGYPLERGEYSPSLTLVLRIAAVFGLPVEAAFSFEPMRSLSDQVYGTKRAQ